MVLDRTPIMTLAGAIISAARGVCDAIDKALGLGSEEDGALKDLRDEIAGLQSETKVYEVLIAAMPEDSDASGLSPFKDIQR
jgi:hypothetical protein